MTDHYSDLEKNIPEDGGTGNAIAELEKKVQALEEARGEERFCWILVSVILLDVSFFSHMEGWGGPIAILALEILLFVILARKNGVEDLTNLLDKHFANWRPGK